MYAPNDSARSSRSVLMRFLVRSWEYRRPVCGWVFSRSRGLAPSDADHRRVRAVFRYLES
jgi:hypothetical protein